jgi:hypothetical protein
MSHNKPGERGAIALITTIIIGILLSIITTGLITLMVSELRQSNDAEQSIRAYYAAQSGVEQGIEKVIAALGSAKVDQLCGTPASRNVNLDPAAPGAVGWTCQQITYSGSPQGSLPLPDKAVQVDVGSTGAGPSFGSMRLEWDLKTPPIPGGYFNAPVGNFPNAGAGWPYAAPIELAIVDYQTGTFNINTAGTINVRNVLAVPRTSGIGSVNFATIVGSNPVQGICNPAATSYHCSVTIQDMPRSDNRGYTFRLRTRYTGTDYRMTFFTGNNGAGTVVNVPDGTATIDITAKSGDAFRRVIYKVPYEAGAATGLDYVLYSDTEICKNFGTIGGSLHPGAPGCPY